MPKRVFLPNNPTPVELPLQLQNKEVCLIGYVTRGQKSSPPRPGDWVYREDNQWVQIKACNCLNTIGWPQSTPDGDNCGAHQYDVNGRSFMLAWVTRGLNQWEISGWLFRPTADVQPAVIPEQSSQPSNYCLCPSPNLETRTFGFGARVTSYQFCISCRKERQ